MSYCSSCGSPIPDGQGSSCSMCYGDPWHGRDGYYLDWLARREEHNREQEQFRNYEWAAEEPPPHKDDF